MSENGEGEPVISEVFGVASRFVWFPGRRKAVERRVKNAWWLIGRPNERAPKSLGLGNANVGSLSVNWLPDRGIHLRTFKFYFWLVDFEERVKFIGSSRVGDSWDSRAAVRSHSHTARAGGCTQRPEQLWPFRGFRVRSREGAVRTPGRAMAMIIRPGNG